MIHKDTCHKRSAHAAHEIDDNLTNAFINESRLKPQGSPISICHLCSGSSWAGAEVQVVTLLRALLKCPEVSLHAIVLNEGRFADELRSIGVAVSVVREERKSLRQVITECAEFVNENKIQVLHTHSYKENLIAFLLSLFGKVPHLVRTEHGYPEPYSVLRNPKHWCVLFADRLAAKNSKVRIVSVSSDLGKYWKRHIDPQNVKVLRNAVDLERVSSNFSPVQAKRRLGLPANSLVIGIAARLEPIKRHDLFVATAAYLAEKIPNAHFVIAGGGRQQESLQRLIMDFGLHGRVTLIGERNDVYDVLRAMDVLLICSDHEGIPMVMLEAMALGVTVVSRKVGGIPEVIRNGVNGILVDSDNPRDLSLACLSVINKSRLRANITQVACDEVHRRGSAEKHAKSMVKLYQSIPYRQVA
jgi:glycosyltransferase involved in cell wall biosynthesis